MNWIKKQASCSSIDFSIRRCDIPAIMASFLILCPDDGDPCDVIVANTRAIVPGAIMSCKLVGVLFMRDEAGMDEKIVAVPSSHLTKRYENIENYTDLPEITLRQFEHFFAHYKDLEPGKWVKIERWGDAEEARRIVQNGDRQKRPADLTIALTSVTACA